MCPAQVGFVPGKGTPLNLIRLFEKIKQIHTNKTSSQCIIFFDMSNAYNTVNLNILFKRLKHLAILNEAELEYLRNMYDRVTLKYGK